MLSRRLGEKIHIGEDVTITVVDIDRGVIRLGIEAPRDVQIFRSELLPIDEMGRRAFKAKAFKAGARATASESPSPSPSTSPSPSPPAGAKP